MPKDEVWSEEDLVYGIQAIAKVRRHLLKAEANSKEKKQLLALVDTIDKKSEEFNDLNKNEADNVNHRTKLFDEILEEFYNLDDATNL